MEHMAWKQRISIRVFFERTGSFRMDIAWTLQVGRLPVARLKQNFIPRPLIRNLNSSWKMLQLSSATICFLEFRQERRVRSNAQPRLMLSFWLYTFPPTIALFSRQCQIFLIRKALRRTDETRAMYKGPFICYKVLEKNARFRLIWTAFPRCL